MDKNNEQRLPLPDKKIPVSVMVIGTFELAVSLLGLVLVTLIGRLDGNTVALLLLLGVYAAIGAGLWAIQEWARVVNIVLHILLVPYIFITLLLFWLEQSIWQPVIQLIIAVAIIFALTRPKIRHKFQTVVPKKRAVE